MSEQQANTETKSYADEILKQVKKITGLRESDISVKKEEVEDRQRILTIESEQITSSSVNGSNSSHLQEFIRNRITNARTGSDKDIKININQNQTNSSFRLKLEVPDNQESVDQLQKQIEARIVNQTIESLKNATEHLTPDEQAKRINELTKQIDTGAKQIIAERKEQEKAGEKVGKVIKTTENILKELSPEEVRQVIAGLKEKYEKTPGTSTEQVKTAQINELEKGKNGKGS
ncbi:MAG: hypothetical protein R3D71_09395 [Rickettsiales bacterium]